MYAADRYTVNSLWFYSLQEYNFLLWVLANITMLFLTLVTFWNIFLKTEMMKLFCLIQGRYWGTEKLPLNEPLNLAVLLCHVQSKVENSSHPGLFAVPHQSTFWVIFHRYSELMEGTIWSLVFRYLSEWIIQMQTLQETKLCVWL